MIATLAFAIPAGAHSKTIRDGNDVPGPLDIGRITSSHSTTKVTHTIQTLGRWSPRLLRRNNFFLGWFSTDGDKTDAERLLYVFYQRGRLRGVVVNQKGTPLFNVRISRPNAKTVRWSFGTSQLTARGGYAWGGFSFYKASGRCSNICVDAAPNRAPSWLDYSPPVVDIKTLTPNGLSTDLSVNGSAIPIQIVAMDKGAPTRPSWKLQRKAVGSSTWTTVDSGATRTDMTQQTAHVNVLEDQVFDFRVVVDDGPHTSTSGPLRLVGPTDDASVDPSSFTGVWTSESSESTANDYMMTVHHSSEVGATFTHTFTGSKVWLIGRGGDTATADVTVDGGTAEAVTVPIPSRSVFFQAGSLASGEPHTVVVTVKSGTVYIDGVATQ